MIRINLRSEFVYMEWIRTAGEKVAKVVTEKNELERKKQLCNQARVHVDGDRGVLSTQKDVTNFLLVMLLIVAGLKRVFLMSN